MQIISRIKTPFREKFGTPRQPLLIEEAMGEMIFPKNDFYVEAFRGIEGSSHLWLIFEFDQVEGVSALVRPPRFAGSKKLGVFATRSPHRPNRLGLSVVKFVSFEVRENDVVLKVSGVDLVDGTPILDIKPYIPYVDRVDAKSAYFDEAPAFVPVKWRCEKPSEWKLIEKVVGLDPRPSFGQTEEFGVSVGGWNVRFQEVDGELVILTVNSQKYTS